MKRFEYSSNNSGGNWWLKDKDWINLEKAGWFVIWGSYDFCKPEKSTNIYCFLGLRSCPGHRRFKSFKDMGKNDRYLGCLAKDCYKDFNSIEEAIEEFERITHQTYDDEGCECCGPPHYITELDIPNPVVETK